MKYTRECLAILVERRISSQDVIDKLFDLFVLRGIPEHIRSNTDPEFTVKAIRGWLNRLGVKTLFIEPGSPWENGYIESFNGKLRDELIDREIFTTLLEAKVLIESWRKEYSHIRPHSSLGYRPPAPEATQPLYIPFGLALEVVQERGLVSQPDRISARLSAFQLLSYWALLPPPIRSNYPTPLIPRLTLIVPKALTTYKESM